VRIKNSLHSLLALLLSNKAPNIPLLLPPSIFPKETWVLHSKKREKKKKERKRKIKARGKMSQHRGILSSSSSP
jgi:hypothetical protein